MTGRPPKNILKRVLRIVALAAIFMAVLAAGFTLPPGDKPWGRADLRAPPGIFTSGKIAALHGDVFACRQALYLSGATFAPQPPRKVGDCALENMIHLRQSRYPYSAPVNANCALAAAMIVWEREVVAKAAALHLGENVTQIEHLGIFACRNVRGSSTRRSEHAQASAIDISGFRLENGKRVTVRGDWGKDTPEGRFLEAVHAASCRIFRTVLGPRYNALHADHFHLGMASYAICR